MWSRMDKGVLEAPGKASNRGSWLLQLFPRACARGWSPAPGPAMQSVWEVPVGPARKAPSLAHGPPGAHSSASCLPGPSPAGEQGGRRPLPVGMILELGWGGAAPAVPIIPEWPQHRLWRSLFTQSTWPPRLLRGCGPPGEHLAQHLYWWQEGANPGHMGQPPGVLSHREVSSPLFCMGHQSVSGYKRQCTDLNRVGSCCRLKPPATFTTLCGFSGPP